MSISRRIFTLATLMASALAQFPDLSASCNSTINSLLQDNTISSCLGVENLEAIALLIQNNSTASLVDPLNKWIAVVCSAPECSTDTLTSVASQLSTACEFQIPEDVLKYYSTAQGALPPGVRVIFLFSLLALCPFGGSTNCITKTLTNVEKDAGGTLNPQTVMNLISTSDTAAYCTDCTKAIYNTVSNDIPQFGQAGYEGLFQQQCGASFTNGTIPSTISESFSSVSSNSTSAGVANTTTPKSNALGACSTLLTGTLSGIGASAFVVISTMFVFLA